MEFYPPPRLHPRSHPPEKSPWGRTVFHRPDTVPSLLRRVCWISSSLFARKATEDRLDSNSASATHANSSPSAKRCWKPGITPDFITVDGGEGGTGAAPQEFSDNLGYPLRDGLLLVHNALVGVNLRDRIRIAASGKVFASYGMASAIAMGADWCNVARGFMFSVGCIQSQLCHTNLCPVGVATQSNRLQKALVVDEKAERAYQYHKNTVDALAETAAACGIASPSDFEAPPPIPANQSA